MVDLDDGIGVHAMTYDFKAEARKACPAHMGLIGASPIYCSCKIIEQALREAAAAALVIAVGDVSHEHYHSDR